MPLGLLHSRALLPVPPSRKLGLDIASSTTLSARAKGDHLVEYMGEVLSGAEVESRYPKGDVGVYCLRISSDSFIDSALFRGVGSFANASKGNNKPNARFVCNPADSSARLVASRSIPGAEIFVSYGQRYWSTLVGPLVPP